LARAVDFSAIAKGFAVDVLSDLLSDSGYPNHLVEVGGELMAQGTAPSGQPWRVAIERPSTSERGLYAVVPLNNLAMATSGDYRNFFTEEGIRYSHTIDPRTGYPVTHRLASVTVLHEHAALADGWATALNVLGPEAGLTLARQEQLAVLMLEYDGEVFRELTTPNFDAILGKHR
jgi:thiamine biosynthesis lipoprotein